MRALLQRLLKQPIIRLNEKYSSRPDQKRVDKALDELYEDINQPDTKRGFVLNFDTSKHKFIIFSDQHKGARDGADDFAPSEKNYLAALDHYNNNGFHFISLGDSEELWENTFTSVKKRNKATFDRERMFLDRAAFTKIFGNHDLYWDSDPLAQLSLKQVYGQSIKVYEGLVLKTNIDNKPLEVYLTHGHQGDLQSDGSWLSKWFVSDVWGPLQAYLRVNPNTPANNDQLKTDHNRIMYEWGEQKTDLLLITGHTHQPVFRSLTQIERLYAELDKAKAANDEALILDLEARIAKRHHKGDNVIVFKDDNYKPCYFNTGCCCFDDGDITGLEIADGMIRLIKWKYLPNKVPAREVLDECRLENLMGNNHTIIKPADQPKLKVLQ
ncbi:metallophosphoesterase [Mucilaginibacter myungsuensis]|uniref:Metallophosphoesterase family protein n=1 Tax=Mucilaginibacter myungsuensis TaxID=649104 RepID=A0A929KVA0_9SPHI|nr:metallophosphoesterase [Mucilaginibacter myungsuensis]MBE9661078.1 metallophosphoesterase family protein [Mucilaginibacter myungsuensis]MDN3597222.1 metallophosphoesterase family protein [Mucilaginibacter myungsuensis]